MAQQNYFTYNIIDVLYYNQPTGEDMANLYGINAGFNRRNPVEYNKLSDDDKKVYNKSEQEFIQAVINKYIIDDYNNNDHTVGTYIGNLTNQGLPNVSYAYLNSKKEIGIELSDMVSNINGTHNYKLISAKDIDFDNVILPNSAVTRKFNWGSFDINRQWGDKPIRINNTFELLNVIDYLLCACDNLWNELYKIKYSVNDEVQIWFTKDATSTVLIHSNLQLVTQDFQLNSEGRTNQTKMITYLDPFNYYTSLNNNPANNFGLVTNFYKSVEEEGLSFDRKIVDIRNQNIILMTILPTSKEINEYQASTTQNIQGQLQQIYAYKIGDELKIYPGARIESFINENHITWHPNDLIDFTNKKLKNEIYFKSNRTPATYSKVYVKFLDIKQLNLSTIGSQTIINPYFLYYINNDNKKVIIAYNYQNSGQDTSDDMKTQLSLKINNMGTYIMLDLSSNAFSDLDQIHVDDTSGIRIPKFYVLSDEFYTTLEVSTPNSKLFSAGSKSITIYYYKNTNKLDCTITRQKDGSPVIITAEEDLTQLQSLAYHGFRYNVPDGQEITFKFDATYIALDTPEGNPLGIKLDDEYYDIMFYGFNNITNDTQAGQYYKLNDVDTTGLNHFKRNFEQFTKDTFDSNKSNYVATDSANSQYKHIWKKQENPYKLSYVIDNDEFITQSLSKQEIIDEINIIRSQNELRQTTYNTYVLNHTLTDGIEQVKMDLRFSIEETSKVKAVEYIVPININKIYNPTINYYTKSAVLLENQVYRDSNVKYYSDDHSAEIMLADIYESIFNKYDDENLLDSIPDIGKYMYKTNLLSLDELGNQKTYNCIYNNTYFEFTYSNTANIVNLLGGWYTDKFITTYIGSKELATGRLIVNNTSYILKSDTGVLADNHPYIFNLNGFGKNYRLHGGGNVVSDVWKKLYPTNQLSVEDIEAFYPQFDLLSISTINNYGSINKQLKIKLNDGGFQLSNICVSQDDENQNIWTVNDLNFNSGLNIKINDDSNGENLGNYQQEELITDYIIKSLPVDIVKTSYQIDCNLTFKPNSQDDYMTYYLPLTYMYINSSTFYPPLDTRPSGIVPDLNNSTELSNYGRYIQSWKSEEWYRPITLSLKLFDNTTITNPYYYESNEATMKFNIKRTNASQSVTIEGTKNIIYVSLNSRYYLSDFIRVGSIDENSSVINQNGQNNNQNNLQSFAPSGSYFYYDDNYKGYVINEIPANFKHDSFDSNHNSHYKYFDGANKLKLYNPDIQTGNDNIQKIVPYPVFRKPEVNNNEYEFSSTLYDYDIYRVSDINKIDFDTNTPFVTNIIYVDNESGTGAQTVGENPSGITSHSDLYCVDINSGFINNFGDLKGGPGSHFNMISYKVKYYGVIGSKNYLGTDASTEGTVTKVCPIIRRKITTGDFSNLRMYNTVVYSGDNSENSSEINGIYEFFEFKYEDVYEIKVSTTEGETIWEIKSIAPIPNAQQSNGGMNSGMNNNEILTCEKAYDKQLELFLLNSTTDFIGTMEYYEQYCNTSQNEQQNNEEPGGE